MGAMAAMAPSLKVRLQPTPHPPALLPPPKPCSSSLHQLQVPPTASVDARVTFGPNKVRNINI